VKIAIEGTSGADFATTVEACRKALAAEGFGVLTEIDIQAKLKEKLGVERAPYLILGACHPPSAHRSLEAVPAIGVLLPCNVCVSVEGGKTIVRAMDPEAAMGLVDNAEVHAVAKEVRGALGRVVDSVCGGG
jgi:uncharacterized protein (DUF302 family)